MSNPKYTHGQTITVCLRTKEEQDRFMMIKEHYAFQSNAGVLRLLIAQKARKLKRLEDQGVQEEPFR